MKGDFTELKKQLSTAIEMEQNRLKKEKDSNSDQKWLLRKDGHPDIPWFEK